MAVHPRGAVRFGAFELDPTSGELRKRGVLIRLRDRPLQVLLALLERPGEVITRKELQERLWPDGTIVEFENGINNAISRLREALGDSADAPRYIETLPRRGYRFLAPLEAISPDSTEPAVAATPASGVVPASGEPAPRATPSWRYPLIAGIGAAVIVASILGINWARPGPAVPHALVVLPFIAGDAGEDSPDEYLAFGMSDALIGELSRFGALKVISQTSAMQYKGARKALPDIARELNVGTVVEGSVFREGGQVRITVQLIDARTDTHLWTQTYTRDPDTAMTTQRELAREVAGLIRSRLIPSERSAVPALRQTNQAAYEAYVKGRYFIQRPDEASFHRAREFFEQSIAADPDFAAAHVGLSNYYVLTDYTAPAEAMPIAKRSAERALALDESLATAHASLAFVHYFGDWDWAATERAFTRAIALDPNDAWSRRWHALYLSSMGREATALEEVQRAIELDPVSIAVFDSAAAVWTNARRFDKVLEQAQRMIELSPADPRGVLHTTLAQVYQGKFADSLEAAQQGVEMSGRNPVFLCVLAIAQHRSGDTEAARQTLIEIDRLSANGYVPPVFLAVTYAWLRDHQAALNLLERAYAQRDGYLVVAKVAPMFDPLRDHPRFQQLLRRMNFPQ